jgi:carboxypeptidase Q
MKEKVKGKVALANINLVGVTGKKNLHRSEKTALAIKYGARGVIMVNGAPGKILLTGNSIGYRRYYFNSGCMYFQ